MEILGRGRGLADLDVVVCRQLQVALYSRAGVFWTLAFVAMGKQHHDCAEQPPLVLTGGDELIDDDLRSVGKVSKLRFPHDQRLRVITAVAVLKTKHTG